LPFTQRIETTFFLFAIRSFGCDENLGVASKVNEGVLTRTLIKVLHEASRTQTLQEAN